MESGGKNYAYITPGGVGVQMPKTGFKYLEDFIKTLTDNYEINDEHPHKTEGKIISYLKLKEVI